MFNYKSARNQKLLALCLLAILALPVIAHAQGGVDFAGILGRIINILSIIAAGVIVIMFIFAGFMYLTARGEPGKIQIANKTILWATIGVGVLVLASVTNRIYNLVYYLIYGNP